jgi:integrase
MTLELWNYGLIYAIIWRFGVETGLRISDILSIDGPLHGPLIHLTESKTGKQKRFIISDELYRMILLSQSEVPFSRKKSHTKNGNTFKLFPTTRQTVHKYIRLSALKIDENDIGTHSMRKTYAYNVLYITRSLDSVKRALNHKYISTTILYLIDGMLWLMERQHPTFCGIRPWIEPEWCNSQSIRIRNHWKSSMRFSYARPGSAS